MRFTRRLFLRNSVAVGVVAPVAALSANTASAARRQVRDVMEELEALIAQQTGVAWSVMLAADETMVFAGQKALPVICFNRDCDGTAYLDDDWGVLALPGMTREVL